MLITMMPISMWIMTILAMMTKSGWWCWWWLSIHLRSREAWRRNHPPPAALTKSRLIHDQWGSKLQRWWIWWWKTWDILIHYWWIWRYRWWWQGRKSQYFVLLLLEMSQDIQVDPPWKKIIMILRFIMMAMIFVMTTIVMKEKDITTVRTRRLGTRVDPQ